MKQLRQRVRVIAVILLCCVLGVGGWTAATMNKNGSRYINSAYNSRIREARLTTVMGAIYDRSGIVLAESTAPGERSYSSNKSLRRAVSQTVGDLKMQNSTGVELFHASTLLGLGGVRLIEAGRLLTGKDKQGSSITLTIDAGLSKTVSAAMQKFKGAVAVINYKTGEILCMVSTPDYDPEAINDGADAESDSAYLNRVLQGQYAPGSVFKIVTLLCALENIPNVQNETFVCDGELPYEGGVMTCAGGAVHGEISLKTAFGKSCNVAFASLARRLGPDKLRATAEELGFNDDFLFSDIILYSSSLPDDIATEGELLQTGIGQGRVVVTPLHMALIAGSIANEGVMMTPTLIRRVTDANGVATKIAFPSEYKRAMTKENALTLAKYMRYVVENGTGTRAKLKNYKGYVCGKTGSAEVSNDKNTETHAWYTGFLYGDEDHPYAVSVILEHGGAGGRDAAAIAAKALQYTVDHDLQ